VRCTVTVRARRALHRHQHRGDSARPAGIGTVRPRARRLYRRQRQRRGRFEQAEGGTLFLDEIGDMPAELQTRLLRVLSDSHFYRVGGHSPIKANVRVIAATHQNLEDRVKDGLFREDLFHRLNVIRLRLPPLRERREDIRCWPALPAEERAGTRRRTQAPVRHRAQVSAGAGFPGNVRQLENLCHWLTVMAPGQSVDVADLPSELREGADGARRDLPADWNSALASEADRLLATAPGTVFDSLSRNSKPP
jgi:two-component system nitrogen regulation response regulator GlnG